MQGDELKESNQLFLPGSAQVVGGEGAEFSRRESMFPQAAFIHKEPRAADATSAGVRRTQGVDHQPQVRPLLQD